MSARLSSSSSDRPYGRPIQRIPAESTTTRFQSSQYGTTGDRSVMHSAGDCLFWPALAVRGNLLSFAVVAMNCEANYELFILLSHHKTHRHYWDSVTHYLLGRYNATGFVAFTSLPRSDHLNPFQIFLPYMHCYNLFKFKASKWWKWIFPLCRFVYLRLKSINHLD